MDKLCWRMVKSPHVTAIPKSLSKLGSEKHGRHRHTHKMSETNLIPFFLEYRYCLPLSDICPGRHVQSDIMMMFCCLFVTTSHQSKEQKIGIVDEKVPIVIPKQGKYNRARDSIAVSLSGQIWLVQRQDPGISILMLIYEVPCLCDLPDARRWF